MRSAARTARSASSSWAVGAPNRATMASPMILSTRPPKASMSATSRSKQPSMRFFTCSGSRVSDSVGVADEVREEDRDDPTLVSPQPQVLPALGAEPCARRHVRTTAGAGHRARIYRGGLAKPPVRNPDRGDPGHLRDNPHVAVAAARVRSDA